MAEFCDVMRQARRMCKSYGDECGPCALYKRYGSCPLHAQTDYHIPADWKLDNMPEVERIVMDWAAKNPEPRYPTWVEWWDENFQGKGRRMFTPCSFVPPAKLGCSIGMDGCMKAPYKCWHTPIPADIAEKLRIKPIGGVNDGTV